MRRADERGDDLKLGVVSRPEDHHDVAGQAVLAGERMQLRPAVVDDRPDDLGRQGHVQAAVVGRVQVGELASDHEPRVGWIRARRQVKRPRPRHGHVARPDHHARKLRARAKISSCSARGAF